MRAEIALCDVCGSRDRVTVRVSMLARRNDDDASPWTSLFGGGGEKRHDVDLCEACASGMLEIVRHAHQERTKNETRAEKAASGQSLLVTPPYFTRLIGGDL